MARDTLWQPVAGDPLRGLLRGPAGSRPPGIRSRDPLLRNIAVGLGGGGQPWGSDTGEDRGLRGPVVAGLLGNHPRLEEGCRPSGVQTMSRRGPFGSLTVLRGCHGWGSGGGSDPGRPGSALGKSTGYGTRWCADTLDSERYRFLACSLSLDGDWFDRRREGAGLR